MTLKNFSFRENWVGNEVAGMKIVFFYHFRPNMGPYFGRKKDKM